MNKILLFFFVIVITSISFPQNYKGFNVAVYARAYEVRGMANLSRLDSIWTKITQQVKVDKIYLETYRDQVMVDDKTIEAAKKYFKDKGVNVAGGITYTINESNRFETFCYSNPGHRKKVKEIAEFTAKHFDEFILDDFFFTSCKCSLCIKAKGNLSWTDYRLKLMTEAAQELVINPAKAVNPSVKVIIKYPNWYEHFQALGFNLETEPKLFDGIYTGTETRDPVYTRQHLQQYESYLIFRYFENIKPGGNGGGWVDGGALFYIDRYAEQLWLTLFAKAPQVTLFDYRQLQRPIKNEDRAAWQNEKTSFNFDEMLKSTPTSVDTPTIARAAGYTFEKVAKFIDSLGVPNAVKSYKPYNSSGEDFLQNFLGMIGIPMDIVPEFPTNANMILLTESASFDPNIVAKIKSQLQAGKNIIITSGLLKALQSKGIEDIVELEYLDSKSLVKDFVVGRNTFCKSNEDILFPQIKYYTNDSWEDISSINSSAGWTVLHQAKYANGYLFVLTIPDNFADLYRLPIEVLNRIRQIISQDIKIQLEGNSKVSLFVYDNGTCIVESFLPEDTNVRIITEGNTHKIHEMLSGKEVNGVPYISMPVWGRADEEKNSFNVALKPHSFRVFKFIE